MNVEQWLEFAKRTNEAPGINKPYPAQVALTSRGSDWCWTVCAIMIFTDLCFIGWTLFLPRGTRLFHHIAIMILTVSSITYFSQASDLGFTTTPTEFNHWTPSGTLRQVWWVRYVGHVINWPLLMLTLVLLTGLCLSDIVILCFFNIFFFVMWLVGGLIKSTYKWGYFTFACMSLFYIWWMLFGPARISAHRQGADFHLVFVIGAVILSVMLLLMPIAWAVADGGNKIPTDSEMIYWGILDLIAEPFYLTWHLFALRRLDLTKLDFYSGKFTDWSAANHTGPMYHPNPNGGGRGLDVEKAPRTVIVDNPPRQGKFFSRRGVADDNGTRTVETKVTRGVPEPDAVPAPAAAAPVGDIPSSTHVHGTKTTTVHARDAHGEPRMSEQTVVDDHT